LKLQLNKIRSCISHHSYEGEEDGHEDEAVAEREDERADEEVDEREEDGRVDEERHEASEQHADEPDEERVAGRREGLHHPLFPVAVLEDRELVQDVRHVRRWNITLVNAF
jgi:hypothetical protein